jgi:hypothetical protein
LVLVLDAAQAFRAPLKLHFLTILLLCQVLNVQLKVPQACVVQNNSASPSTTTPTRNV